MNVFCFLTMDSFYNELIVALAKNPLHKHSLPESWKAVDSNPFCGDEIEFFLQIDEHGKINGASFQGEGCALSQAAASLLAEIVSGKSVQEILHLDQNYLLEQLGVPRLKDNPVRIKCALLPMKVMKLAAYQALATEKM